MKFYREMGDHFKKYKKNYILGFVFLSIVEVIGVIPPKIISIVADSINSGDLTGEFLSRKIILLTVISLAGYLFGLIWTKNLWVAGDLYSKNMKSKLYEKILNSTGKFFENNTSGELMTNITTDQQFVVDAISFGLMALFDGVIYPIFIIVMMSLGSSFKLAIVSVIPLLLIIPIVHIISNKIEDQYKIVQEKNSKINDAVLEMAQGIRVIRAYSSEDQTVSTFEGLTQNAYRENMKLSYLISSYGFFVNLLPAFSYFVCLYLGAKMIKTGDMTLGSLISLQIYLGMLIWPMMAIAEYFTTLSLGKVGLERLNQTLYYPDEILDKEGQKILEEVRDIEYKNLNFKYPTSKDCNLKGINVDLKRGMTLGVVGRTGSGKSTFIKQLLREYPLDKDMLFINGTPIEEYKVDSIFEKISYVPQESVLFSKSIRENILFGRSDATEEELEEVLKITDLQKDISSFNEGLDTLAGEKGISLSGGQKQRIAIARAIIADRELLIMDDSLSAVDSQTEKKIISHINEKRKGRTNIIVSHRLSAVENADFIIVLEQGEIVERGTHEELLNAGGWYKEQYMYQVRGGANEKNQ